jgi:ligand-binding sensor domain-containing protein
MNCTKKIVLLCTTFLLCFNYWAQRGLIRYTRENGLAANSLRDVCYDNQGFIWMASAKGIDRFDGQKVVHFSHELIDSATISSNDIRSIKCSDYGVIWATTLNQGLVSIDAASFKITNYNKSNTRNLYSNSVKQMILLGEHLWLLFDDQLQFFMPKMNRINTFALPVFDKDEIVVQINIDHSNPKFIWLFSNKYIWRFDYQRVKWKKIPFEENEQFPKSTKEMHHLRLSSAIQDSKGNFYIGLENGDMIYFDKFQFVYRYINNPFGDLSDSPITSMDWRNNRYLYLCLQHKEIVLFDTNKKDFVRYDESERGALFPRKLKTRGSQIAIASEIGLFLHDESLIFGSKVSLDYRIVSMIDDPVEGRIQLIEQDGIYSIRYKNGSNYVLKKGNHPKKLEGFRKDQWAILCDDGILLWSSTKRALEQWYPYANYQERTNVLSSSFPFKNNLLLGASDGTIWCFKEQNYHRVYSPKKSLSRLLNEEEIYPCFVRLDNKIVFSSGNALFEFDPLSKSVTHKFNVEEYISSLLLTNDGELWIGTFSDGIQVVEYKTGKITRRVNAYMGMQDDEVLAMVSDSKNHIWVLNRRCVAMLNTKNWSIQSLEPKNGMGEVTDIRILGNKIYFLELDGYVVASTNPRFPKLTTPEPYVLRVKDLSNNEYISGMYRLSYEQNNLIFEFGVLDFSNGDNNLVSYRLVGLDNTWQNGNNKSEAGYFNLPAGNYQFQVRVIEDGRIFINEFKFQISKPFWSQWWFFLAIFALGAFSIWLFIRSRIMRIRSNEKMKTDFNIKINELESKALRAQMNPHFLFNSLNSIRLFILKNEVDSAENYIAKFSKLLRMILNHSRQDMITVYDEIQSLKLYLEFERLRFDKDFDFDLQIDGQEVLDCQIPPMIIQPFIENAIWHGLMPREGGKGIIKVSFLKQQSGLYVTVQDNGIGREKAKENNRKRSLKEGSVGLEITKDRLHWLSLRTERLNEFEIEDLVDENNEPIGTLVTLYFETPN